VVTTNDASGLPHGITVSSFCSVSLVPPLVLICIEKTSASHDSFGESGVFVVNVLSGSQQRLSERFAEPSEDKFTDVDFENGLFNVPVLKDALANIECRLTHTYDSGDHTIFVGSVERVTVRDGSPLVYFEGDYTRLAGTPDS
jgi:flavin reductase (DIM6/NTAB) family NADH-FMN oxidoreductase RutF